MRIAAIAIISLFFLFFQNANSNSIPKEVFDTQGSIVRILNFDTPSFGYGTSYSTGTGYIIDSEKGYILTNQHVIEGNIHLLVYFNQWEKPDTLPAYVIYDDEERDLAVIRVQEDISDRKSLKFADTTTINMGDDVFVFGYPATGLNNFEIKLAKGIIGSHVTDSIIQLSATVNPGNSGGPALNERGEVVGTIYSKLLNKYENVGNIRSNRLNYWTLDSADKYMTDKFFDEYFLERDSTREVIGLADTVDMKGYRLMAQSHKYHGASERVDPDSTYRRAMVDMAIDYAEQAIEKDSENIMNRFHYVNMLFDAATLSCQGDSESEAGGEKSYALKLYEELEQIDKTIEMQPKKKRSEYNQLLEFVTERFTGIVTKEGINCEAWTEVVGDIKTLRMLARARKTEFDRYLSSGRFPFILAQSLRGEGYYDPFESAQKYRSSGDYQGQIIVGINLRSMGINSSTDNGNIEINGRYVGLQAELFNDYGSFNFEIGQNFIPDEVGSRVRVLPVELWLGASVFIFEAGMNVISILSPQEDASANPPEYTASKVAYLGVVTPIVYNGSINPMTFGVGLVAFRSALPESEIDQGFYFSGGYYFESMGIHLGGKFCNAAESKSFSVSLKLVDF